MTLKLMKYELRASLRVLGPAWCALLVLGVLNRVFIMSETLQNLWNGIPAALLTILFVVFVLAAALGCVIFMILRFYRSFVKDEGYLMFTLPVKTSQLINSKLFSAYLCSVATGLFTIVGAVLILAGNPAMEDFRMVYRLMSESGGMPFDGRMVGGLMLMYSLMLIVGPMASILQYYLAMAIGQLSNKNKGVISVVVYLAINAAMSGLMQLLMWLPMIRDFGEDMDHLVMLDEAAMFNQVMGQMMVIFGVIIGVMALLSALYYFLTWRILKNKLNLQ